MSIRANESARSVCSMAIGERRGWIRASELRRIALRIALVSDRLESIYA